MASKSGKGDKPEKGTSSDDAPKKKSAKAAEKTATDKTAKAKAPKAAKAASKPKAGKRGKAPDRPWARWLAWEAATWVGGAAAGASLVGFVLWQQAREDVKSFLADPGRTYPGVVYSAPMEVREGEQATASDLAGDLLAAGYEKVPAVTGGMQFSYDGSTFEVATDAMRGPGFDVPDSRVKIVLRDDVVGDVSPGTSAVLRPTVLGTVGDPEDRRAQVTVETVGKDVPNAIIAMEDGNFWTHHGVDPWGVVRAAVHDATGAGGVHGGSTLTQQLAKNLFLSPERTLQRKVREAFFAMALEHDLPKKQILEMYLQEVYLGQAGGVPLHGVEEASRAWFGKSAGSLSPGEAATIAGVISSPNTYSPLRHPEKAKERRDLALDRMVAMGFLDEKTAAAEKAKDLVVDGALPGAVRRAPWAVDEAVDQAERSLGEGVLAEQGYKVYTTIQPLLQRAGERAIADGMAEVEKEYPKSKGAEASLVAVRKDGAVVALVGGRNYAKSPFDRATDAWREVGSTAKPFTLLAAFDTDEDLTPLSILWDSPIVREVDGKPWRPQDYDGTFRGQVTVREAIEGSLNVPAIRLSEQVGLGKLQQYTRSVGLSRSTNFPSAALGAFPATPLEVAGAYTVFPGGGTASEPWLVLGIADRDDKVVVTFEPKRHEIASAAATAMSVSILEGVVSDGTGARAKKYGVTGAVGGKSGTTNDYRDAWFTGFTPDLVATVWVGRDVGENVGLAGSRAALPSWARFLVATGPVTGKFATPSGMVHQPVCVESHKLARTDCPTTYSETFRAGHVPDEKCDLHGAPTVTKLLGGLFGNGEPQPPSPDAKVDAEDATKPKKPPLFPWKIDEEKKVGDESRSEKKAQ